MFRRLMSLVALCCFFAGARLIGQTSVPVGVPRHHGPGDAIDHNSGGQEQSGRPDQGARDAECASSWRRQDCARPTSRRTHCGDQSDRSNSEVRPANAGKAGSTTPDVIARDRLHARDTRCSYSNELRWRSWEPAQYVEHPANWRPGCGLRPAGRCAGRIGTGWGVPGRWQHLRHTPREPEWPMRGRLETTAGGVGILVVGMWSVRIW